MVMQNMIKYSMLYALTKDWVLRVQNMHESPTVMMSHDDAIS